MTRWVVQIKRPIENVAVAIEALWIGGVRYDGVGTGKTAVLPQVIPRIHIRQAKAQMFFVTCETAVGYPWIRGRFQAVAAKRPKKCQTVRYIIAINVTQSRHIAEMVGVSVVQVTRFSDAVAANLLDAHPNHLPGDAESGSLDARHGAAWRR